MSKKGLCGRGDALMDPLGQGDRLLLTLLLTILGETATAVHRQAKSIENSISQHAGDQGQLNPQPGDL